LTDLRGTDGGLLAGRLVQAIERPVQEGTAVTGVQWRGTDDSWRELVKLYAGLESVALWAPNEPLTVETENGREQVPLQWWVVRRDDGVIELRPPD
jgi:hypothetical protein